MNTRARMPFALVGVIVLVASTTLSATVVTHDPSSTPTVDRAMEGAKSETVTALRTAADDAATGTAANPVTVPANSTAGRALDDERPYRDALRLRLYLLARERLESVEVERGGVVATASLPPVPDTTEGYRTAIERVHIERAGTDDTALRVEVSGVRLTGVHQGRQVASDDLSPTFVVSNPALFLHDRTTRFERRVNASVAHPGLGQRITTRLYPIAWARGYAQYGGAPIANVIATRHVELVTNDALVAEQRQVFGAADPGADRGVAAAGATVATEDLLAAKGVDSQWTDTVLNAAEDRAAGRSRSPPVGTRHDPPEDTSVTVGVNGSADRAFAETVGIEGEDDLARAIERAHTVQARVETDVRRRVVRRDRTGTVGGFWTVVDERRSRHVTLKRVDGRLPRAEAWETRDGATYRAREVVSITRRWQRDGETRTTRVVVERTYRIAVAVQARTVPVPGAPEGNLDGPLAGTTDAAVQRAIDDAGGLEAVARDAVDGDQPSTMVEATAETTVDRGHVEGDLRDLRDRARNRTTTVSARDLAAGRANPPRRLLESVADDHEELRGHPDRTVEERTRVAAREVYLTNLGDRLGRRAEDHSEVNRGMANELRDHIDGHRLDGALEAPRNPPHPPTRTWNDPAGNLSLAVETGPSYLPTGSVDRDRIGARSGGTVHPLKTRNVNLFPEPYGQVVDSVFDRIPVLSDTRDTDTVSLATAAQVLAQMDGDEAEYEALHGAVDSANEYVRNELVRAMTEEGVPRADAEAALATDASTAKEARMLANGSAVDRAVRATSGGDVDRDRLRVRLESVRERALTDEAARPSMSPTNEAADAVKREFRDRLQATAEDRLNETVEETIDDQELGEDVASLPAGMPLAPVPGYWYATGNAWYVQVNGTYERFVVRANRGDARASTAYVREGRVARLEADGRRLRLGRDEPISFQTETLVVVVVPAGGNGVGDTGGERDEQSPGWPPAASSPNGT